MPVKITFAKSKKHKPYLATEPDLLTRDETAAYIGVCVGSLAHWSKAGKGPTPFIFGRRSYYHLTDIHAWMSGRAGKGRSKA